VAAGTAADWVRGNPSFISVERWVSGSIFVGLGVTTALTGHARK
jgi:threonine/homoserine/homoserine lactone efflux protein